uniref:Uncharacterized protein n=1 Tax=Panagrolaimus sp. ES5 TaxID=591445 RepID=A0AC34FPE1_9BILA
MWWTIHLDGGPRRVNHAAVAINDKIYSFGGYCSGPNYNSKNDIDVFVLDTVTYRWYQVTTTSNRKRNSSLKSKLSPTPSSTLPSRFSYNLNEDISDDDEEESNNENQNEHYLHTVASELNSIIKKDVPFQRYGHTVVGYNGKAYLFGGRSDEHGANSSLHEFDPITFEWKTVEAKGIIPPARDGHSSNVYGDKMYIFGGFEYTHRLYSNSVYAFNFKTLTWEHLPTNGKAPSHRDFHASAIVKDKMYIFGGRGDDEENSSSTTTTSTSTSSALVDTYCDKLYCFNLKTNCWEEIETAGDLPTGRRSHSMWEYRGKLYLFGGYDSINDIHFNDFYVFDTEKFIWTKLQPNGEHPTPRRRQCSAIVGDKVFIFGGTMPDKAKRPGTLCDLADMYVLDYCASLKTLAARALIQYGTSIKNLPPLGKTLDRDLYNMSQLNTITSTTATTTSSTSRSETIFSYST